MTTAPAISYCFEFGRSIGLPALNSSLLPVAVNTRKVRCKAACLTDVSSRFALAQPRIPHVAPTGAVSPANLSATRRTAGEGDRS